MARNASNLLEFLQLIGKLKSIKRTGWVLCKVQDPESIAGHMYRMGIMAMLVPESSGLDINKCLRMALVHDIGECIIGDITPYCGVSPEEKHKREAAAITKLEEIAGEMGPTLSAHYHEYAAQASSEAKFVKELDLLDMIIQAYEYEEAEETPGRLQEFFQSTQGKFHHPWVVVLLDQLYEKRKQHMHSQTR